MVLASSQNLLLSDTYTIPDIEAKGNSVKVTRFALEVNPTVRALNSAQVVNNNL